MNAIRIRKHLDSETLVLPELQPLLGKDVEIIVLEEPGSHGSNRNWEDFFAEQPDDLVDATIYETYRTFDRDHTKPPQL